MGSEPEFGAEPISMGSFIDIRHKSARSSQQPSTPSQPNTTQDHLQREMVFNLFQSLQSDEENRREIIEKIYLLTHDASYSLYTYFCQIFPFSTFYSILTTTDDSEIISFSLQALGHASDSPNFPSSQFANEAFLSFLMQCLSSGDTSVLKASVLLLTNIVKLSPDCHHFLFANNLPTLMLKCPIIYPLAELLFCLTKSSSPLPLEASTQLSTLIKSILQGQEFTIQGLALESAVSLLKNEAPGVDAAAFTEFLPPFLISGVPSLVQNSIEILLRCSQLPSEFFALIMQAIDVEKSGPILKLISKALVQFCPGWNQSGNPAILQKLLEKYGGNSFAVDLEIAKAVMFFASCDGSDDTRILNIIIGYISTPEMSKVCLEGLISIYDQPRREDYLNKISNIVADSVNDIEELARSEDEEVSRLSLILIDKICGANRKLCK